MALYQLILAFCRRHWQRYLGSGLMLLLVALLTVWIPRQVGHIVDEVVGARIGRTELLQQLALLVLAGTTIYFLRVGWRLQLYSASYRLGVELRTGLYRQLTGQGLAFYQGMRTGDLMALATNDVDAVEMAAGEAMLAGFDGSLTLFLVVGMMIVSVDWRLSLLALLPFPLMAFAFWRISNRIHRAARDSLDSFGDLNDHVQESLSGVRTLRALGLEARTAAQFAALAERAAETAFEAQRWQAAYEPAVGFALVTASTIALGYGGLDLVWTKQISIGALTAFGMYLGTLIWPMFAAGWVLSLLERGRAAWARLNPVLTRPLSVKDDGPLTSLASVALRLEDVSFYYPGQSAAALLHVHLQLGPGETLGIVGPTGAGKSTLLRLLMRQYDHDEGEIALGGQALSQYALDVLHQSIAWVPQESFLFSTSVQDNILLARPEAGLGEVRAAARMASIDAEIGQLQRGYATLVGERGLTLSGGQRQRVTIARALLSNAPMLLLDDALSAVDTQTETAILAQLRGGKGNRSLIVVSHRLSAVMAADQIVVLKHGVITERGSHQELLELGGWYATQWRHQQLEAELESV